MTTSRPLALAVLALATTLAVSACSSSNQTPTEEPTSVSASPSAESSAPAVPSDWQTVALEDVAEISVPSDWTVKSATDALDTLRAPKGEVGFSPGSATVSVGNLAGGDQAEELEWTAKHSMENDYSGYDSLKRLPDEVINGTPFYRLQFESEAYWFDVYGTVTPDAEYHVRVAWKFSKSISRKEAEAVWSPVMPSFKML